MKLTSSELEQLIDSYANVIRQIARKYYLVGGTGEDLFQEGMIGLLEAYKNYNSEEGYNSAKFKNFAKLCIKRQMYDAIKHANKKNNAPLNNYLPLNKVNSDNEEYERAEIVDATLTCNPEELVIDKEEHDEKIAMLKSKLSKLELSVLDLYLAGESQSQIAAKLNKSVKSIDNTIQRIKNKLK